MSFFNIALGEEHRVVRDSMTEVLTCREGSSGLESSGERAGEVTVGQAYSTSVILLYKERAVPPVHVVHSYRGDSQTQQTFSFSVQCF